MTLTRRAQPVVLCDIQTYDSQLYYWASKGGTFPAKIGGGTQVYQERVKSAGPFTRSRSLRTDAGNLILENLSGPAFRRNTRYSLGMHEFEGALCVVRYWSIESDAVRFEFHGFLSETDASETEAQFRVLQLLDGSVIDVPDDDYSETCTLRYKGPLCGSSSPNASCDHTIGVCTSRSRFNGTPNPPPLTQISPVKPIPGFDYAAYYKQVLPNPYRDRWSLLRGQ